VEHSGNNRVTVKAQIENTGSREGAEVVQLYLGSPGTAEEPPKQLKGFEKIRLQPGEIRNVSMELNEDSLSAWDPEVHAWRIYPGTYTIMVGSSSRDIRLQDSFNVQ
jgi:beta-glucosidase